MLKQLQSQFRSQETVGVGIDGGDGVRTCQKPGGTASHRPWRSYQDPKGSICKKRPSDLACQQAPPSWCVKYIEKTEVAGARDRQRTHELGTGFCGKSIFDLLRASIWVTKSTESKKDTASSTSKDF